MDCSLPGSSVHRISQARILEWVAISFSRGSSPLRGWNRVSCIVGRRFTVWAIREVHWSYKKKIFKFIHIYICQGNFIYVGPFGAFLVAQTAKKKNLPALQVDLGLIPGSGRFPGIGNGNSLQFCCLENPVDRGLCRATVHRVTKSWTWLRG